MTTSRAALSKVAMPEDAVESVPPAAEPQPAHLVTSAETSASSESKDAGSVVVAAIVAPAATDGDKPRYEGPPLRTIKGNAKAGMISQKDLRAERREKRNERLKAEAEEALANGDPPPAPPTKPAPNANRSRLKQAGDKGKLGGGGKQKNQKKKPEEGEKKK